MIRNATVADMTAMLALGRELIMQTPYADQEIDVATAGKTLGNCISSAMGFAVVAERDGKLAGMMLGCAVPLFYSRARMASDLILYSRHGGDGVRMVRRFIRWAWSVPNVVEVTLSQSSGINIARTGKLWERMGMKCVGTIYTIQRPVAVAEVAA